MNFINVRYILPFDFGWIPVISVSEILIRIDLASPGSGFSNGIDQEKKLLRSPYYKIINTL
jgi:hypothetical protein